MIPLDNRGNAHIHNPRISEVIHKAWSGQPQPERVREILAHSDLSRQQGEFDANSRSQDFRSSEGYNFLSSLVSSVDPFGLGEEPLFTKGVSRNQTSRQLL
jgi:hypothetical protein